MSQNLTPSLSRTSSGNVEDAVRRVFDVVVSLVGLIVFAPLMLLVAFAIWFDSPGPIFFSQTRLGQNGRLFRLHKFRKFHHQLPANAACAVTVKNDKRMTRVGAILERSKLDELPQLWNILKGEMSVVGPRPETLDFYDCFEGAYLRLLDHKPGIFGPNQVFFRNEGALYPESGDPQEFYRSVLFPLKARIDLSYFPQRKFLRDIAWMVRGVLAVFNIGSMAGKACKRIEDLENLASAHEKA